MCFGYGPFKKKKKKKSNQRKGALWKDYKIDNPLPRYSKGNKKRNKKCKNNHCEINEKGNNYRYNNMKI